MKRFKPTKLFQKKTNKHSIASGGVDSSVPSRGASAPTPLGIVKAGLQVASAASSAWPPLQGILNALQYFINNHEAWLANRAEHAILMRRLKDLEKSIREGGPSKIHEKFLPRIQQLDHDLQGMMEEAAAKRYLGASEVTGRLNGVLKDIGDMVLDYQVLAASSADSLDSDKHDQKLIWALPRARDARYLCVKHKECLPGTRTNILFDLNAWARDTSALNIYWLNGHAGSGKSTIAQSFCHQAFADGILGASFFCSRDTESRSNLNMIFPTLSFQLACHFPEIRVQIVEALKRRPDVATESLKNQLEALLIEPLEQSSLPIIIVIDALDECKDSEPTSIILTLLSYHVHRIPHIKWFFTGRPEPALRQGFRMPVLRPLTEMFILHDVVASDVDADIHLYLCTRLSQGFMQRSNLNLPEAWPSEEEIQILTRKCEQLFIFASTAVIYIQSHCHDPAERLSTLCSSKWSTSEHGSLGLDQLYTTVLEVGYEAITLESDYERIKAVIASVVLATDPIPIIDLAFLLELKPDTIVNLIRMLHAILRVPKSNDRPITLYHKSFFDYVTDASRCTNPKFYVDPPVQHCMWVNRCLQLMNSRLKRNPCSLPRYSLNADMELEERQRRIGRALEYACSSWVTHLGLSKISFHTLKLLGIFLKEHLVQWMEVMSLVDKFPLVIKQLHQVYSSLSSVTEMSEAGDVPGLLRWVDDGRKLAYEFREPSRHLGAPPIFSHNGKLFAVVFADYDVYTGAHIYDITTGERLHEFSGEGICFSPDDTKVSLVTGMRSAMIVHLRTGTQYAINPSDNSQGALCNQAFSPSGRLLAIGEGDAIVIWNVYSGQREMEIKDNFARQLLWLEEDPPCFITIQNDWDPLVQIDLYGSATVESHVILALSENPGTSFSVKQELIGITHGTILYLLNWKSRQMLCQLSTPADTPAFFAISPLHPLLFLNGQIFDITDPTDPKMIQASEAENIEVGIIFSPTENIFASCREDRFEIYRLDQFDIISKIGSHRPPSGFSRQSVPPTAGGKDETIITQLYVSQDASKVFLIAGIKRTTTVTKIYTSNNGITNIVVDVLTSLNGPYSLNKQRIVAEVDLGSFHLKWYEAGWIDFDQSTGNLAIFKPGNFTHVRDEAEGKRPACFKFQSHTHTFVHIPSDSDKFLQLNSHLKTYYSSHSLLTEYPVLVSDDYKWIVNGIGQRILWVPYRMKTIYYNRLTSWRWSRGRLFMTSTRSLSPFIVDFAGVDVQLPTVLQVFEKKVWSSIVISDLHRLEEGDDLDAGEVDEGK
ncbi:hypothetical protein H0H92_011041 [Tricholoma furcatifolium]|nr:hypothetical protein H0H92_011041 [Tricholoma furcatifolium]